MNDASKVVRAWRKAQSSAATPIADAVPAQMRDAGQALMQALWREATELANTSLSAAQTGWEAERAEAEGLRAQLAAAFDDQSAEMQKLQTAFRDALAGNDEFKRRAENDADERRRLASHAEAMTNEARNSRDRCADLQDHIDDLRGSLSRAHEQAALFHAAGARAAGIAATEIAGLNAELLRSAERPATTKEEAAALRHEVHRLETRLLTTHPSEHSGPSSDVAKSGSVPPAKRTTKRGVTVTPRVSRNSDRYAERDKGAAPDTATEVHALGGTYC